MLEKLLKLLGTIQNVRKFIFPFCNPNDDEIDTFLYEYVQEHDEIGDADTIIEYLVVKNNQ